MIRKDRLNYLRDLCTAGMAPHGVISEQHREAMRDERELRQRLARRMEHIEFAEIMKAAPDALENLILAPLDERELSREGVAERNGIRCDIADIKTARQRVETLARRVAAEQPRRDALATFLGNLNTLAGKYRV